MSGNKTASLEKVIAFYNYRLDRNLGLLYRDGEDLKLSPKLFDTLEFLVINSDRVVTKAELLESVWKVKSPAPNSVEQVVSKLRRLLPDEKEDPKFIKTIPGRGYQWIAEIHGNETAFRRAGPDDQKAVPIADVKLAPSLHLASEPVTQAPPPVAKPDSAHIRRILVTALGVVTILIAGVRFLGPLHRPRTHIARVSINGDMLLASNASGELLWKYVFDGPLKEASSPEESWKSQIVDLKGDGDSEVLIAAVPTYPQNLASHAQELFCFSSNGKLLWRYQPKIQVEFNSTRDLNGPWWLSQVLVVPGSRSSSIWVAVNHGFWWPAFIVKLSPSGAPTVMFVSSGMITSLLRVQNRSGSYVVAGGINNEYRAAALAVIAENAPPATSPQGESSEYKCLRGCPSGRAYRYILLPRSELNAASELPYNWVQSIVQREDGVTVRTLELGSEQLGWAIDAFYGLSRELGPISVAYGDSYAELHRHAEGRGWIKHNFDNCPERNSPAVLKVADENGKWSDLPLRRGR